MKFSIKILVVILAIQSFWYLQTSQEQIISEDQLTNLYCHGVCGDSSQINDYKDLMVGYKQAVNFPDTQKPKGLNFNRVVHAVCNQAFGKKHINRTQMYLGQGEDIETIKKQINPDKPYILYGLCRGGAAIINYVATYNPRNILALVLDEAFADVLDIVEKLIFTNKKGEKLISSPLLKEQWLRFVFPSYPRQVKAPVDNISAIKNKDLVVFLSYTHKNSSFHYPASTWKNYIAFKKAKFENVYLCELDSYGQNAQGTTKLVYLQRLNSVFKKHKLPYKAEYATLTDEALEKLQPPVETIIKKLKQAQR